MAMLSEVSQGIAQVVAAAEPAVVRVESRRRFPASGIVWSKDGLIVTANHVVRRENEIKVGFADGTAASASLVGRDPSTDIALLRAEDTNVSPMSFAGVEELNVGNIVIALGRPGRSIQATLGVISAIGPGWRMRYGGQVDKYIQTDVLMYPGFSGGPLVTASGALVGLNSSAFLHGISVALPSSTIERVVGALQEYGRVRRGYLGVSTQVVRLQKDIGEQLGQKTGLLTIAVEPASPADQGGLKIGDTIVKVGSAAIHDHDDLLAELIQAKMDEKTPITIVRGGELQTLNIKIGEQE